MEVDTGASSTTMSSKPFNKFVTKCDGELTERLLVVIKPVGVVECVVTHDSNKENVYWW